MENSQDIYKLSILKYKNPSITLSYKNISRTESIKNIVLDNDIILDILSQVKIIYFENKDEFYLEFKKEESDFNETYKFVLKNTYIKNKISPLIKYSYYKKYDKAKLGKEPNYIIISRNEFKIEIIINIEDLEDIYEFEYIEEVYRSMTKIVKGKLKLYKKTILYTEGDNKIISNKKSEILKELREFDIKFDF